MFQKIISIFFPDSAKNKYKDLFEKESVWSSYRKVKKYDSRVIQLKNFISF